MDSSMHNVAPAFNRTWNANGNEETCDFEIIQDNMERYVEKGACFWQTIILSTIDNTLYPYSHYLRTLDLHRLEWFLGKSIFCR